MRRNAAGEPQGPWARYLGLLVLVVALGLGLGWLPQAAHADTERVSQWQYRWTDTTTLAPLDDPWDAPGWRALELPGHPESGTGVLWLRARLPAADPPDAAIAFDAVLGAFEAWVGATRAHVFPDPEGLAARGPPGLPWQVVRVPGGSAGRILSLRILAQYRPAGVKGTPLYGSRADLLAGTIARDAPRLVVGLLVVVLGLIGLIVVAGRKGWRLPVGYALDAVTLGAYVVYYTHLKDLLLDAPRAWFVIWLVALPLHPIGALLFLDGLFGSGPRGILRRLLWAHTAYAALLLVAHVAAWRMSMEPASQGVGVAVFGVAVTGLRILIVSSAAIALVVVVRRAVAGSSDARIYLLGFGLHLAFAARDVLAALGVATLSWKSHVHIGVLALVGAQALLLQRRYGAAQRLAATYASELSLRAREKELMLRDLHDGIGTLASNVRMLADIGQRKQARAQHALGTIGELSGRMLAELRAFVQTLDEDETSWPEVVSELRRYGAALVEGQGRRWSMTSRVATGDSPTSFVSSNLLRVVHEAITNALKQPDGTYVNVELAIVDASLTLTIENDGGRAPREPHGVDAGRGLANLRSRATELGATLQTEFAETARVRLEMPLPHKPPAPALPSRLQSGNGAARG